MKEIRIFKGDYEFLSNFYPSPIKFENYICPTLEHAFQASKTSDSQVRKQIIQARTPSEAKSLGKKCKLIPNWQEIKLKVMMDLIRIKFSKDPFKSRLLNTGDSELIEGNWWGDKFWGVDERTGVGKNNLGKILMEIREELKTGTSLKW